jgi:predicted nucleic acid-binding protein
VLTVAEVKRGVRREKESKILGDIFAKWSVLPVTFEIASLAAEYLRIYAPTHGLDVVDALNAATAEIHAVKLATLNLKHFPMFPGLTRPY